MRAGSWHALFERDAQGLEMQRLFSGELRLQWKRDALGRPTKQRISTSGYREMRQRHYSWPGSAELTQIADSSTGLTQFTHDAVGNLVATRYADARAMVHSQEQHPKT